MGTRFLMYFPLSRAAWVLLVGAGLNYFALPASAQSNSAAIYTWTTLAGYSVSVADDGVGPKARFNQPSGIAADTNGNTYVVDAGNYTIRRISEAGVVTTIAGLPGVPGFSEGFNSAARFNSPGGIAVDRSGNVLVTDQLIMCPSCGGNDHYVIRKISPVGSNWVVTTVTDSAVDHQHARTDRGNRIIDSGGLATDGEGNIYLAEPQAIRKITPIGTNWVVTTVANVDGFTMFTYRDFGSGFRDGFTNSFIPKFPGGPLIAADRKGTLYCASGSVISKLTPVGTNWGPSLLDLAHVVDLETLAGKLKQRGRLVDAWIGNQLSVPTRVALTNYGGGFWSGDPLAPGNPQPLQAALIPDLNALIQGPSIYNSQRFSGVILRPETQALLARNPQGADLAHLNRVLLEDSYPLELARNPDWVVTTIAGLSGSSGAVDGLGADARFQNATSMAADGLGNLYVADGGRTIRALRPQGTNWVVSTLAGSAGSGGSSDGSGTNALFKNLFGVAVDRENNLIVSDSNNNTVRQVTAAGAVRTIAGSAEGAQTESAGSVDGVGGDARFKGPRAVAVDRFGNVYVADTGNSTIRRVTPAGNVTTIVGSPGISGFADGVGSDARFSGIGCIAVDSVGNVYVAGSSAGAGDGPVRRITPAGLVSTIPGVTASDVTVDKADNLVILSLSSQAVQRITLAGTKWVVSTIAPVAPGDGEAFAMAGDGRLFFVNFSAGIQQLVPVGTNWVRTTIAGLRYAHPYHIAVDRAGYLYLGRIYSDSGMGYDFGHTVQRITPAGTDWQVSTIGGYADTSNINNYRDLEGGNVDGAGSAARFGRPIGIAVDVAGNVYVADEVNNNIRKGTFTAYAQANPVVYTPPPMTGQLTVTLTPAHASGQWRFPWEVGWHNSGVTVSNLAAGNYPVEFRTAPGWLTIPLSQPLSVTNGGKVSILKECYATSTAEGANSTANSLTVDFGPASPPGAGWRFLGENRPYFTNVFTTNLAPATYAIEFAFVSGRVKPSSRAVQIRAGLPSVVSVNYPLAPPPPAGVYLPRLVNNLASPPFGFNGQLQSNKGYGSGVAVDTHVVLTAGHLVFEDATLSYVSDVHWFFRRDAGVSEPLPQAARSFFVLSGYAARRTNDYPVQSTAQSRNLDVAALYFPDPVAGGSFGGYLPSDAVPNTWLTGTASKMLVGYPVDGSQFGDASIVPGKMYQTDPQPYPLSLSRDSVEGRQEVYLAPWFLSYPGNSGGPLYVELNGSYYPAGVYLGTLFDGNTPTASAVRAIDSTVVNLITNAAALGASGTNNTGGGVITIIPSQGISGKNLGYISFRLGPPAAVTAGVGWRLQGDTVYSSATNYTRAIASTNAITIEFKPIPGWRSPTNFLAMVLPGQLTTFDATYTAELHPQRLSAIQTNGTIELRLAEVMGGQVYRIERRPSLTTGAWETVSVLSNSYNLVLPKPATNEPTMFYRGGWQ